MDGGRLDGKKKGTNCIYRDSLRDNFESGGDKIIQFEEKAELRQFGDMPGK